MYGGNHVSHHQLPGNVAVFQMCRDDVVVRLPDVTLQGDGLDQVDKLGKVEKWRTHQDPRESLDNIYDLIVGEGVGATKPVVEVGVRIVDGTGKLVLDLSKVAFEGAPAQGHDGIRVFQALGYQSPNEISVVKDIVVEVD